MRRSVVLTASASLILASLVAPAASAQAPAQTSTAAACAGQNFTTAGDFTCSVPAGQTIRWTVKGGNGGEGQFSQTLNGGLGAKVTGTYSNSSDLSIMLYLHVGEGSTGRREAVLKGGGFTSIATAADWDPDDALVIAAGGGAGAEFFRGGNGFGGAVGSSGGNGGGPNQPGAAGGVTSSSEGASGGFGGAGTFLNFASSDLSGGIGGWPGWAGLTSKDSGNGGDGYRQGASGGSGGIRAGGGGAGLAGGGGGGSQSFIVQVQPGAGGGGLSLVREGSTLLTDTTAQEAPFIAFEEAPIPECDGSLGASAPAGSGTASDPYLIASNANLAWVRANPAAWGSSFEITSDIDASICEVTSGIGTRETPFTGTFDGAGHVITGLTISAPDQNYVGLFGYTSQATVKSVALEDASISGAPYVGGLIGVATRTTVKSSSVTGSVSAGSYAGGLVGFLDRGSGVANSYARASVSAAQNAGGLAGRANRFATIDASYAAADSAPTVTASAGSASALVASGSPRIQDVFWNSTTMSGARSSLGTAATSAQMRRYETFAGAAWNINDGWALVAPWSICSTVNDGFPFLSARYDETPCPSLTASPPQAVFTEDKTIAPITVRARGFQPTTYSITDGKLPKGLTFDEETGAISGTPTKVNDGATITIAGTDGDVTAETQTTIRVRQAARKIVSTDGLKGPCDRQLSGETLTITCADPGEFSIDIPAGGVVTDLEVVGADGGAPAGLRFDSVTANPRSWDIGGSNWGGVGATVEVAQEQLPALESGSTTLGVVVGEHGVGAGKSVSGGGYSSVSAVRKGLGSGALIAAAGGGGGSSLLTSAQMKGCAPIVFAEPHDEPRSDSSKRALAVCMSPNVAWSSAGWTLGDSWTLGGGEQAAAWTSEASGQSGSWVRQILSVGWASSTYGPIISGGLGGTSYGPQGATVAPNFTEITGPADPRDGRVIITIDLSSGIEPASCSPAVPELGQAVLCDQVGLARVPVPAGALVASVNVAGGGGGGPSGSDAALVDGGAGGLVNAWMPVSTYSAIEVNVGGGGASSTYTGADGSALFGYGLGGGATTLSGPGGETIIAAGGGGGANGYSGSGLTAQQATDLQSALAGVAATTSGMTLAPATGAETGGSASAQSAGGAQGASGWVSSLVSSASFSGNGGSYGGQAQTRNPAGAAGSVLLRFCGLPGAPNVTSVVAGGLPGRATVDVTASEGSDGGCGPLTYQFRTSADSPWTSAPGLSFPIVYNLTSGQSVCVQMRAQNEAGWGPASAFTCGTARNTNADTSGGSSGGSSENVVINFNSGTSGTTSISVGVGGVFYVQNAFTGGTSAYVRNLTGSVRNSAGTTCTSSVTPDCPLSTGLNGPFTVDTTGTIRLYKPVDNVQLDVTIS